MGSVDESAAQGTAALPPHTPSPAGWRETLDDLAARLLAASNKKGQPQYQANAYAHTYGGVIKAIHALEKLELSAPDDQSASAGSDAAQDQSAISKALMDGGEG